MKIAAVFRLVVRVAVAAARLPSAALAALLRLSTEEWLALLSHAASAPATARAPPPDSERSVEGAPPREASLLAVDIGGTRTKFLLVEGTAHRQLPPVPTARIWQNEALAGPDKFEPASAPRRMQAYLSECGVDMARLGRIAFAVPGTVDLTEVERDQLSVVRNTPSMSPKFRGFDFKHAFRDVCPAAKVSATADNLAAALGVACQQPELRSALVVVLGTAPAVATLFRDPHKKGEAPRFEPAVSRCLLTGRLTARVFPRRKAHRDGHLAVVGVVHQGEAGGPARVRYAWPHRCAPLRTAPHRTAPHRTAPHRSAAQRSAASHRRAMSLQVRRRPQGDERRLAAQANRRRQDPAPPGTP
jgi:hypothetical protein